MSFSEILTVILSSLFLLYLALHSLISNLKTPYHFSTPLTTSDCLYSVNQSPSPLLPLLPLSPAMAGFTFLVSKVTPETYEDMMLGASDEREHVT